LCRKNVLSLFLAVCLFISCVSVTFAAVQDVSAAPSAQSAVLMDAATGTVLYEKNADERRLIASTTKIMTALVVLENCPDLEKVFQVPAKAVGIEGSSIYLKEGQQVSVRDLLYGLLLKSGNDAAAALAIHCAGSIEGFALMMNGKAKELGMNNSSFENPHGLNADHHYSTARDMAVLTRAAHENDNFSKIVGSKYAQLNGITIKNHNRMLWSYDGADGVKTGYTINAGRCLVSSATRSGMRLIAVTLNDHNDWADHTAMLDYGFDNFVLKTACAKGELTGKVPVIGGETVNAKAAAMSRVLIAKKDSDKLDIEVMLQKYLWAPVIEGQRVGMITVKLDGKVLDQIPLLAS
jgi:D-alanyl-D-alanine carboxypeptidase